MIVFHPKAVLVFSHTPLSTKYAMEVTNTAMKLEYALNVTHRDPDAVYNTKTFVEPTLPPVFVQLEEKNATAGVVNAVVWPHQDAVGDEPWWDYDFTMRWTLPEWVHPYIGKGGLYFRFAVTVRRSPKSTIGDPQVTLKFSDFVDVSKLLDVVSTDLGDRIRMSGVGLASTVDAYLPYIDVGLKYGHDAVPFPPDGARVTEEIKFDFHLGVYNVHEGWIDWILPGRLADEKGHERLSSLDSLTSESSYDQLPDC